MCAGDIPATLYPTQALEHPSLTTLYVIPFFWDDLFTRPISELCPFSKTHFKCHFDPPHHFTLSHS